MAPIKQVKINEIKKNQKCRPISTAFDFFTLSVWIYDKPNILLENYNKPWELETIPPQTICLTSEMIGKAWDFEVAKPKLGILFSAEDTCFKHFIKALGFNE